MFFFLIPLQVHFLRKGRQAFFNSLAISFGVILIVKIIASRGTSLSQAGPFLLTEGFILSVLMIGLLLVNTKNDLPYLKQIPGRLIALIAATAGTGLLSVPLILYLKQNKIFTQALALNFETLSTYLNTTFGQGEIIKQFFQADELRLLSVIVFFRSYLFYYFLLLCFSWWAGSKIGARSLRRKANFIRLIDFKIPDHYIWPLIGSLALILINTIVNLGVLQYLAWNVLLVVAFLFGLEGIGIMRHFFDRYKLPRGLRITLGILLIILALSPRINVIVLILIPGLGVSEIWLKYRTRERSENTP